MINDALQKLEEIKTYPLFQNLGNPFSADVIAVTDWKGVRSAFAKPKWANCRLMARNRLQRLIEERCINRMEDWDPTVLSVRPEAIAIATKVATGAAPSKYVTDVRDALAWDILFICLEFSFKDAVAPPFHLPFLDPWYASGHFPCGWSGKRFPDRWNGKVSGGKLFVF